MPSEVRPWLPVVSVRVLGPCGWIPLTLPKKKKKKSPTVLVSYLRAAEAGVIERGRDTAVCACYGCFGVLLRLLQAEVTWDWRISRSQKKSHGILLGCISDFQNCISA